MFLDMDTTITSLKNKPWMQISLLLPVLLICMVLLYLDSATSMVKIWLRSDTHMHGILIIPISLYLIWLKREIILNHVPKVDRRYLVSLVLLSAIWLLAAFSNVEVLKHFTLVLIVIASVACLLGGEVVKIIAFPLFYLLFLVPVGEDFIEPLQDFTAAFVVAALKITGIPVLLEGRYFSIPSGDFEVAKACSGIRYLIVTVSLGTVYAYLMYTSLAKRLGFIGIAIITPIIANGIRAYGIVMLAHLSNMQLAVGVDHFIYGWVFFGIVIFILFWFGSLWKDKEVETAIHINETIRSKSNFAPTAILIIVCSAIGPAVYAYTNSIQNNNQNIIITLPDRDEKWVASNSVDINWKPEFKLASDVVLRRYQQNQDDIYLYVALYSNESQDEELINSENTIYNSELWKRISESASKVNISDNDILNVNEVVLRSGSSNFIIWSWYDVSGKEMTNSYLAKLNQSWSKLMGTESGSAVIAIATTYDDEPSEGKNKLKRFLNDMRPVVIFDRNNSN